VSLNATPPAGRRAPTPASAARRLDAKLACARGRGGALAPEPSATALRHGRPEGKAARRALGRQLGLAPEDAAEFPLALCGEPAAICDALLRRRERWGFSYTIVPSDRMEAFAPVVARLAGK
jgi:hypothetical protein